MSINTDIAERGQLLGGFRNKIINGNFDIWQRGTSFGGNVYSADRWNLTAGSSGSISGSRSSFSNGQTQIPGNPTYYISVSGTPASGGYVDLVQKIENCRTFMGQTVVVSFWAKGSTSGTIGLRVQQHTDSSARYDRIFGTFNVTTSWQYFTLSRHIPSITDSLGSNSSLNLIFDISVASGVTNPDTYKTPPNYTGTLDITRVQAEEGSVATPFEERPVGLEMSLCQRYYQTGTRMTTYHPAWSTWERTDKDFQAYMRVTPSINISYKGVSGQIQINDSGATTTNISVHCTPERLTVVRMENASTAGDYILFNFTADAEL